MPTQKEKERPPGVASADMGLGDADDIPLPSRDEEDPDDDIRDVYDYKTMKTAQKRQFRKRQEFAILTDEHNQKIRT